MNSAPSITLGDDGIYYMDQPIGVFAGELHARAREYHAAFIKLSDGTIRHTYPTLFLATHCLELALKSFLAASGIPKTALMKRFSHNVSKAVEECQKLGMPTVAHLDEFANTMHHMNEHYDFRYPTGFNLHVPSPSLCADTLSDLLSVVRPIVDAAQWEAQQKWWADTQHLQGHKVRWSD